MTRTPSEDVTAAAFEFGGAVVGTGIWNFNAGGSVDRMVFTGTRGELTTPIFTDGDVIVDDGTPERCIAFRNPPARPPAA